MSDNKSGVVGRSTGCVSTLFRKAVQETSFTKFWFLLMAILAFGFTIVLPLGCMSPPTRYFTFFSVNPHVLAHRYNTMVQNNTGIRLYDEQRLDADLRVLPDIYRFGMSGVCREFNESGIVLCTRQFPQPLDLKAIIDEDIAQASLSNSTASHFQKFWDTWGENSTENSADASNKRETMVHASAGLTVTSLVIAPIGLCVILFMYTRELHAYATIATFVSLFDAALMVAAATLAIVASAQYAADMETTLGGQSVANTPYWDGNPQYPPSYGLIILASVAVSKIVVLPILALILVVTIFFLVVLGIALSLLVLACVSSCLAACGTEPRRTGWVGDTYYY